MTDGEWPRTGSGRGSQNFPSFRGRRPWNPPWRGRAVRHRYHRGTNGGIPARSARMTAEFEKARRYHGRTNRGILRSLTLPLNDVHKCKCAARCKTVDAETQGFRHSEAAGRGIPHEGRSTPAVDAEGSLSPPSSSRSARMSCESLNCGAGCAGGRGRVIASTVILAQRGSPIEGRSSTLSFPRWNQQGDSRAERENDSRV